MNLRRYITYPHIVSSLALFIALGGSAYAVTQIDPNSVGTTQLKADAVKSGKIADGTIKRKDAKAEAFATPPQLADKLGVGATAANSKELLGMRPVSAVYSGGARAQSTFITAPGGFAITLGCDSDTYNLGSSRAAAPASREFDLFESTQGAEVSGAGYTRVKSNTAFIPIQLTADHRFDYDITSEAGRAEITLWGHVDEDADTCLVKARMLTTG